MDLIERLLRWFSPRGRRRELSALASGELTHSQSEEWVSTAAQPIKPHHLRLTHRDPRLLPKAADPLQRVQPRIKRKRLFVREEAMRLFSRSLRTRDRTIRDLTTDSVQLERYALPQWKSEADLANALGLTVGELRHYSIHRDRERCPHYISFAIRKRSGEPRILHAPKRRLKAIQRQLHRQLVTRLPVSEQAHGFVPKRSVATNAGEHVGRAVVVKFDIKSCFPTITFGRVRGLLIALGYSYPVATALAILMTEPERQPVAAEGQIYYVPIGPRVCPQGAPTSPGLCNAILLRLDRRLAGLAAKLGFSYTRYADDLTFSGDAFEKIATLLAMVPHIVVAEGFTINRKKTQVLRKGGRQRVTGVIVNQVTGLPRTERRRLRAAVHNALRDGIDSTGYRQLAGRLAYLKMLNPDQARPLLQAFASVKLAVSADQPPKHLVTPHQEHSDDSRDT